MFSLGVVVGTVRGNFFVGGAMAFVFDHFQFCLDCSKTRFHEGVVFAVVGVAHALPHPGKAQQATSITICKLVTTALAFCPDTELRNCEDRLRVYRGRNSAFMPVVARGRSHRDICHRHEKDVRWLYKSIWIVLGNLPSVLAARNRCCHE